MKKIMMLALLAVITVIVGCGGLDAITMQEQAQDELAKNCWKYQVELYWENPNVGVETAKLWTMLTGLANGLSEKEVMDYIEEMEAKYAGI